MYSCPFISLSRIPSVIYSINVNTATFSLSLYKNDTLFKTYPIGIGKMLTPTPTGKYTIINKALNPGGPYGARWMGLSKPGYGIHGTNDPSSIGKHVSKGCIRMHNKDVIELYNLVPIGTIVTIV